MAESVTELRAIAEEAARRGGAVLARKAKEHRTVEFKKGIDPVTDADRASEAEVLQFLRRARPGDSILAEESGLSDAGGLRWYVDPLDGTANYARQIPQWCVSVAVGDAGGILAGAVYDPSRDELYAAAKGQGAALNGEPIRVATVKALDQAMLCIGFPFDVRLRPEPTATMMARALTSAHGLLRTGSAALNLAYVACGRYDGHFQLGVNAWDVAAGVLLVTEAGGVATNLDGSELKLDSGNVFASSSALAAPLSALVRAALAEAKSKGETP